MPPHHTSPSCPCNPPLDVIMKRITKAFRGRVSQSFALAAECGQIAQIVGCGWGESFRCRCESCANVSSWRCICVDGQSCCSSMSVPSLNPSMHAPSPFPPLKSLKLLGWGIIIVPDGVVGPQADPLWDGSVLLLRLCKLLLGAERLVRLFAWRINVSIPLPQYNA